MWLLSPGNRGFGGFTISSLKMISNVSHEGQSDRMCPLSAVYIIYITGGGICGHVDIPEMETALLVLCLLIKKPAFQSSPNWMAVWS